MNRCPTCGTQYADDAKFCTKDGTRLLGASGAGASTGATPSAATANPLSTSGQRGTAAMARAEPKPAPTYANLTGQTLDKRYKIERKLGEGGMSFVYLATDIATQEQFAIKVLSEALSQDA